MTPPMYSQPLHFGTLADKKILVTGGAGFIGSNIVEYLLKYGAQKVRVLDDLTTGFEKNLIPFRSDNRFEWVNGDMRDASNCMKACEGMDLVTHQAALGSVPRSIKDPVTSNDINVNGFVNVLFAAREAGISRFIYASSSSVYGDDRNLPKVEDRVGNALSPYAVGKKANELYATVFSELYDMQIIGLRYFNIFGPNQDPGGAYAAVIPLFMDGVINNKEVYIDGDGSQTRDFTFVENAVQANVKALTCDFSGMKNHEVFNVAVGERFTVNQLFQTISGAAGSNLQPNYRESRVGDIHDSLANIAKAQKFLKYQPLIKFQEGIEKTLAYFKSLYT